MGFVLADRVQETTASSGAGPYALAGASPNFQAFGGVLSDGAVTRCALEDVVAHAWEVGLFVYASSGNTLTRLKTEASSTGSPISFAGNASTRIFMTQASPAVGWLG